MQQILKSKLKFTSPSGIEYSVRELLGAGGQGEVYRVTSKAGDFALKWYFPSWATQEQWEILSNLITVGPPTKRFLWPLELVKIPNYQGFGYIMQLRDKKFKGIVDLMKGKADPSFSSLITAGFQLADSYFQLHSKGLCYRDISFGNAFFDPSNGEVLICDNDNVTIDKSGKGARIGGTMGFMAPEIVRGDAVPSRDTDLFSLSVLLFYMFHISHPLEGKKQSAIRCWDAPAMRMIYGTDPVFIFDPTDSSNRPDPLVHTNAEIYWGIYPQFIKELFIRAFTTGLNDPENGRVQENEWRAALIKLRDSIIYCQNCSSENFYDLTSIKTANSLEQKCWNCKTKIRIPPRMKMKNEIIMLNYNTILYQHHIDGVSYNFDDKIAQIVQNPQNPNIWGLNNISSFNWIVEKSDNSKIEILPGKTISLSSGLKIDFGTVKGEIRV